MRASLYAVAVMAFASPRRAAIRRKNAPSALLLALHVLRGQPQRLRRTVHARTGRTRLHFASGLFGFGARPSQLPKCFSLGHRLMSVPISLNTTSAVLSSIPSMAVRSTPAT